MIENQKTNLENELARKQTELCVLYEQFENLKNNKIEICELARVFSLLLKKEKAYGSIIANAIDFEDIDYEYLIRLMSLDITRGCSHVDWRAGMVLSSPAYETADIEIKGKQFSTNNGIVMIYTGRSVLLMPSFYGLPCFLRARGYKYTGANEYVPMSYGEYPYDYELRAKFEGAKRAAYEINKYAKSYYSDNTTL